MKYNCDICNFETDNRSTWSRHKKSKKHAENLSILETRKNDTIININNIKKEHEIELLKEKLRNLENQLVKTESQLTETKQHYESQLLISKKHYESHIETLKTENNFQKQLINSAGGMIQKSMNTFSYLLQNYNNAPCLNSLNDYSVISNNNDYLIKELILHHNKNKLDKYLGDFIVKHYKKDNPELQAMWNSDTDRLNYIIRELYNINNNEKISTQWIVDRKGLKMTQQVINPLLEYITNLNTNYLKHQQKINEESLSHCTEKVMKDMCTIASINNDIKNNILSKEINKYIAPYFYFDKNANKIC
ncbi:hypothetical protein Catovirus_1_648 [Catovirus CTV1]|uniref:C2H2-type domain-containing protein n=1 Tax=Catovirus CTV1 TaxID=1977631 RepID=A0A1V0SAB9_9VIRU|nr:hypothetical protein Catovirus_1_648 [Catovirus CTV1]